MLEALALIAAMSPLSLSPPLAMLLVSLESIGGPTRVHVLAPHRKPRTTYDLNTLSAKRINCAAIMLAVGLSFFETSRF
jgi:hypothetical protein